MIIFENRGWQTNSDYPDTNYLKNTNETQPKWVVHDNSDVAAKVMSHSHWNPVEDKDGNLIDIIPVEAPMSDEEQVLKLKSELEELDREAIRPLRAIAAGTGTEDDQTILADLERQAAELRQQLTVLEDSERR